MKKIIEPNIDVADWRSNREELARLNGAEHVLMCHPTSIGKTQMAEIASKLADARMVESSPIA